MSEARRSSVAFCSIARVATTAAPAADPVAGRTEMAVSETHAVDRVAVPPTRAVTV